MAEAAASTTLSGHCLCGRIRWSTPGPVLWAGHCHCESCRRATSAPVSSFFGVPRADVTWEGTPAAYTSSEGVRRGYCKSCGTPVFYQNDMWPEETHLYAATLDDPTFFKPKEHYHWAERVTWQTWTDTLPRHEGSAA